MTEAIEYFASQGYPFPSHENPADYLIDVSAVDNRTPEAEETSKARVGSLIAAWREHYNSKTAETLTGVAQGGIETTSVDLKTPNISQRVPIWRQINVLTRRTFVTTYRDPMGITGSFFEAIAMGVICGWIFYKVDGSLAGIRSRQAALYITSSLQGYLVLLYETYRLTSMDIKVFDRERGEGVIGVVPWLISRRIARLATEDIAVPFIFSVSLHMHFLLSTAKVSLFE